jgi:nicotinamidase-related amidase
MIRWNGMDILETLEEIVDPKHTLLLMWDFAERIIGNAFNHDTLVGSAGRLLQGARDNNVLTMFSHQNNMHLIGDTGAPTVRLRMRMLQKPLSAVTELPEPVGPYPKPKLVEELQPREGDIMLEKFTPNAFLGTCFEWWLKKHGIKTIVLAGFSAATGISGTAREATNLGYYAVVARDCIGTRRQEEYDIAVAAMEQLFDVVDADDIVETWNRMK